MAPLSLKIILDEAAITKIVMFDSSTTVAQAHHIVRDKIHSLDRDKEYGFFLTSADDDYSGVWLEGHRTLEYYMLREGDSLFYLERMRNLRLRMLDGSVKTLQVDESKSIGDLMSYICDKIGATNYEEYGLCREHMEIEEEGKPMFGTLTLRKKTQAREKDIKLEQLSKKLKTDDNVEWLDQHKTLRELHVDPKETLLFKRRLYYSDRKVDARDPVQLNLLYVQTRDAILDGRQIVTEAKAVEFAGLQCQVHYDDFSEEKHKPGFIENLREFLPAQYATSWGIEKKIFKEHKKHQGLSPLEAKHLYTKTARELPTYGVTFFLVKEKHKGKKKLIPRLLGINSESILRLDEETKEILQVWPLTQVKSYRAASESFTLDFGDYSEKEYAVKTNEAFRIKDILQGYIDIIRKKLAAPYNVVYTEGEAMCEDMVEISRGTVIQNIVPSKIVEQSFVGPSRIISVEQGHRASEGTKITTVHEVVTVTRGDITQQGARGEILSETPNMFGRRLNRINSLSVKSVVLLSDDNQENLADMHGIVADMENELPAVVKGVREICKKIDEEQFKKLLDELDELCDYINNLSNTIKSSDFNSPEKLSSANDIAKKLADISAQMYLSLDPKSKRRSQLINSSRKSFIADEKTEAHLRRLSLKTAAETTHQVLDSAYSDLNQEYKGSLPGPSIIETLDKSVCIKMGKLNAAVAMLLNAHSDPKEVNFSTAVTCMTTIKELIPELVQDVKTLNSFTEDEESKSALTNQIKKLIDRTAALCRFNGTDDSQKLQEASNAYGEVARKLIYTFNRGERRNNIIDKENEIMDLAKAVAESSSNLLIEVNDLNGLIADDTRSEDLDAAGVKCADAARELYACAQLTAASIHEPHCQSALTGACENLTSSVNHLTLTYKPIVDDPGRHYYGKRLTSKVTDLNKALERLMDAYANLSATDDQNNSGNDDNTSDLVRAQKLKFIATISRAKKALAEADQLLQNDYIGENLGEDTEIKDDADVQKMQSILNHEIAQLNNTVATLVQASTDEPDYGKMDILINNISQLIPEIIRDTKTLKRHIKTLPGGDNANEELFENLKDMLEATKAINSSSENHNNKDLNDAAMKLAKSTGKLYWIFNPQSYSNRGNQIMDQSKDVGNKTSQLLMDTSELICSIGGDPRADELEAAGVKCADAAKGLMICAELIIPTITDSYNEDALETACNNLESSLQNLTDTYEPIVEDPERYYYGKTLSSRNQDLMKALNKLKELLSKNNINDIDETLPEVEKAQRLKFISSLSRLTGALQDAEQKLQGNGGTENNEMKNNADVQNLQSELTKKIAKLNAAIATLIHTESDIPDYERRNAAIDTIAHLTPEIIRDGKTLEAHVNGNEQPELSDNLRSILDATKDICTHAAGNNDTGLTEAAMKFAESSRKLTYIFNPRSNLRKGNQIIDLARDVENKTSVLLQDTHLLSGMHDRLSSPSADDLKLNKAITACRDAAKELERCAKLTAPSIQEPVCQRALSAACEGLAKRLQDLALAYKPIFKDPSQQHHAGKLVQQTMDITEALDTLKEAYSQTPLHVTSLDNTGEDRKRLKFIASLSSAKKALLTAEQQIDSEHEARDRNKMIGKDLNVPDAQSSLSQNIALLNAAVATLLHATMDIPEYEAAEGAIIAISKLTPNILNAAECIHCENPRENILDKLKPLVKTLEDICDNVGENRFKDLNNNAMEFSEQSEKIYNEYSPQTDRRKENQILDLSRGACRDASKLLTKVYQLAKEIGGEEAAGLDDCGTHIVDTAQVFLTAAQVTAPTMKEPECQSALLSFTDTFSDLIKSLDNLWTPLTVNDHQNLGDQLRKDSNTLQATLNKMKEVCLYNSEDEVNTKKEQLLAKVTEAKDKLKEAQMFSAKEKLEELPAPPLIEIVSIMTKDKGCIERVNIEPTKMLLCDKLSELNQIVALLVQAASVRTNMDHKTQEELVEKFATLAPETVKNVLSTHKYFNDETSQALTEETKALCEAGHEILASIETENIEELNNAVSKYAYSSGKLYYIFSPFKKSERSRENEILHTAQSACERTSLMLSRVSRLAQTVDVDQAEPLDTVGVQLADAAHLLLTNAQLIAPSIRLDRSQTFLLSSIDRVSRLAEDLGNTWSPLIQPHEQLGEQLDKDQKQLKLDLERLKDILQDSSKSTLRPDSWKNEDDINSEIVPDLSQNDSKVPDRDLIIEETPLKELASKILNSAKKDMERGNLSPEERNAMKTFTNELSAAICALDLANARCKIDPLDSKKRQDLENVIQNLQHLCLISRLDDDQQSNIIDLMLFVKGVTSAADDVYGATASINPEQGKKFLMEIRDGCEEIKSNSDNLSNPQDIIDDSLISDMLLIEKFAQDCDSEVSAMQKSVQNISDDHSRKILNEKLRVLIEKCDLLKFATKGSVSSAAGVAIEENLQNLTDAEKKIEFLLSCAQDDEQDMDYDNIANNQAPETAKTALSRAVIARKDDILPQALTQYAIKMLAAAPKGTESQLKLKSHLENLSNLLKKMTLARGRRVATWQDDDGDDVTDINKSIIKELCDFDVKNEDSEAKTETMDQSDILNLIAPKEVLVSGDKKDLSVKLSQQIQKLSFMIGTVILSCQKPESLSRSVHATAGVVAEITAITRAIKNKDIIQGKRIEEASNHLIAATYHLLETSESVSQALHKPESRRRLLDACRSLTDAVNKFAQVSSPSDKTKRDGEELQRNVQLQQILLTTDQPTCALGYADCLEALQAQGEVIHKLDSQELMSRSECSTTLRYVTAAACTSAEYAAHSAYLLSISEEDQEMARKGVFDISRLNKITDNIDDVCSKLISADQRDQMIALEPVLNKQLQQLSETIENSANKVKEEDSQKVKEVYGHVSSAMENLTQGIHASPFKEKVVISRSMKLLDAINRLKITISRLPTPRLDESPAKRQEVETFTGLAKDLLTETSRLVNQVTSSEEEVMTWVMYGSKQVIRTYEALLTYIRNKGTEMKLLQTSEVKSEEQEPQKSHLQIQMDMINKWLRNPACKQDVKNDAILAAENIIDMGQKMCEDLKDSEKEEMLNVVIETKELLKECSVKYNSVKASLLLERVRELKGMLERGAVTRVVEEFLDEQPLEYFENIHKETDVNKREFLLDKKIAELLAQLARVSRTAKFVSDTSTAPIRHDLMKTSNQVELLAPTLVKAAQDSVRTQDKQEIENYIKLVMQYADSLSRVRELCDRAVDPMDFAQAAGEIMARIKESSKNDPQKSIHTSRVIIKLGNRVVEAGMSSANVQKDPELQKTLASIKNSIASASSTKIDLANEIIRRTGEVESALGGETIFQKEPEADQHIFAAAHSLHAAVREWSARDNEVVAVAKRVAVLMAQLAHHMYNDRKSELIATAKAIVGKSHEVAALARKLAMECSDTRIRNNLLQVCQRIPLISGQLKMLTTVKGSTLGKQGTEEDKEAMNMLIGNAQNLMTSIQEIVYVAESASVKINSQRGRRIRWVRRNYY